MNIEEVLSLHPSIIYSDMMLRICHPLRELNIIFFSHVKIKNNTLTINCNVPAYLQYYYQNAVYNFDVYLTDKLEQGGYYLWDLVSFNDIMKQHYYSMSKYGFSHCFTLVKNNIDCFDLFHFAVDEQSENANSFYIQNVNILEQYADFFLIKIAKNSALKKAYMLPVSIERADKIHFETDERFTTKEAIKNFSSSIKNEKSAYKFHINNLPKRELECAIFLAKGYTTKEIALSLDISPRTVEEYLNRLKSKLGAKNKFHLVNLLLKNALI